MNTKLIRKSLIRYINSKNLLRLRIDRTAILRTELMRADAECAVSKNSIWPTIAYPIVSVGCQWDGVSCYDLYNNTVLVTRISCLPKILNSMAFMWDACVLFNGFHPRHTLCEYTHKMCILLWFKQWHTRTRSIGDPFQIK